MNIKAATNLCKERIALYLGTNEVKTYIAILDIIEALEQPMDKQEYEKKDGLDYLRKAKQSQESIENGIVDILSLHHFETRNSEPLAKRLIKSLADYARSRGAS